MNPSDPPHSSFLGEGSATRLLVVQAQAGDRSALAELYELHLERVTRIAALTMGHTLKRCQQDIEDVVHDAFTDAIDRVLKGRFNPNLGPGGFRNWIARIVVNKVRTKGRQQQGPRGRQQFFEPAAVDHSQPVRDERPPGPATQAELSELHEQIEAAILSLAAQDRDVIMLRYYCGMTSAETCRELGFDRPEQVRWTLHRAMERLRRAVGRRVDDWATYWGAG